MSRTKRQTACFSQIFGINLSAREIKKQKTNNLVDGLIVLSRWEWAVHSQLSTNSWNLFGENKAYLKDKQVRIRSGIWRGAPKTVKYKKAVKIVWGIRKLSEHPNW